MLLTKSFETVEDDKAQGRIVVYAQAYVFGASNTKMYNRFKRGIERGIIDIVRRDHHEA